MTEIEAAYRTLAICMGAYFKGEPKVDDLRGLLRDAYQFRDDMNAAIERAEKALRDHVHAKFNPEKP